MAQLVEAVCLVCVSPRQNDDVAAGLAFLDVVVRYGVVPQACLRVYVLTLCRTINIDVYGPYPEIMLPDPGAPKPAIRALSNARPRAAPGSQT